jgi:hypothetical protein
MQTRSDSPRINGNVRTLPCPQDLPPALLPSPNSRLVFVLNGFGYAVDSLILLIQSIIAGQAALEFHPSYANGLTIAAYVGCSGASQRILSAGSLRSILVC